MPATEQTRYNMRRLHKLFALSSVLLALATVWMLANDHFREWKTIQRKSDHISMQLAQWQRLQAQSDDVVSEHQRLEQSLAELLAQPLPSSKLDAFRSEVRADARRRNSGEPSFAELEKALLNLNQAAAAALAAATNRYDLQLQVDRAQLQAEDAAVRAAQQDGAAADQARAAAQQLADETRQAREELEVAIAQLETAQAAVIPARRRVFAELDEFIDRARFREEEWIRLRKSEMAELDVAKARLGFGVRDARDEVVLKRLQDEIERRREHLKEVDLAADEATAHRHRLQQLRSELTEPEEAIRKRLDELEAETKRLDQLLAEKRSDWFHFRGIVPLPGKKWLELPILDAFNSPRKIENIWSADLDRPAGSFGRVTRFDRCTTCHQELDRSSPVDSARPALGEVQRIDFALSRPEVPVDLADDQQSEEGARAEQLKSLYGLMLAGQGLLNPGDVAIQYVHPTGPARKARRWTAMGRVARAGDIREQLMQVESDGASGRQLDTGLRLGDVIVAVDGDEVPEGSPGVQWVTERLLRAASTTNDATPLRISVRRGLPHPYAGHPRLDLFVGDESPHRMADFGCTVCHDGQGSATEFKWASHSPNDLASRRRWRQQYDWFDNPHWNYPMIPRRFVESSCVKCHHDVVELERSERFPDAPAARLARGYRLVRTLGCYGCHEVLGYDTSGNRIGPDLRLEPNYYAAALQFKGEGGTGYDELTDDEREQLQRLIDSPEDDAAREAIVAMIEEDARRAASNRRVTSAATQAGAAADPSAAPDGAPRFSSYVHDQLLPLFRAPDKPGTLRKVGPSLRFVRDKLDVALLRDWIRRPSHFRPSTRMPQPFGLWNHLPAEQLRARRAQLLDELAGEDQSSSERNRSVESIQADLEAVDAELDRVDEMEKRYEPLAVYAMTHYLLEQSQQFTHAVVPEGITPAVSDEEQLAQIERGKIAFEELGCLACHDHVDFPEIKAYRDPDYVVEGPDLSDLATKFSAARNPNGVRWLYSWIVQPSQYSARTTMPDLMIEPVVHRDVDGVVTAVTDPVADIVAYLQSGPPTDWQPDNDVPPQLDASDLRTLEELALTYLRDAYPEPVAMQILHEGILESESAELRGAERALVVTERERETLSPAQMTRRHLSYVAQKTFATSGCCACHDIPGMEDAKPIGPGLNDWARKDKAQLAFGHVAQYVRQQLKDTKSPTGETGAPAAGAGRADSDEAAASPEFYLRQLESHSRIGFLYQKLTAPRSFDYYEARNKKYTERLKMPQFSLTAKEREAIMTFVLGLVADPPRSQYVYSPDSRTKAVLQGTELLTKYSCRGCHVLETEQWQLEFPPGEFGEQLGGPTYPFLASPLRQEEVRRSASVDRRGLRHASVSGMPSLSVDGLPLIFDDEEFPIEEEEDESFEIDRLIYSFDLWQPAAVDGYQYRVGDGALYVLAKHVSDRRRSYGGAVTKYLLPRVVEREKLTNPNAKGSEAWGWLPPVLLREGQKVQPQWLHNYLLQPHRLRPAVIMRMPRYNMSDREAAQLVDYFAARDAVEYPYPVEPVRQAEHLLAADLEYAARLESLSAAGEVQLDAPPVGRHLVDAMRMVLDSNYCVKCHLVGDYNPPGIERVKAPNLADVHQRLRSEHVRRWVAKPNSIEPYTPMPVNIPYDPDAPLEGTTVPQELYHGSSTEQLDALVDLLMNYDRYVQSHAPVTPASQ